MSTDTMEAWEDYLLINQLEISSVRVKDCKSVAVVLSNRYSGKLTYVLLFYYYHIDVLPDFKWRILGDGCALSILEVNQLRARVQKVLNSVLQFYD